MKQRLKQLLSRRQKQHIVDANRISAAVLLPIYWKQEEYYLLFTKRTQRVKEHKGQISFPGGAYQDGDGTLVNTALRECAEEIGLMAEQVEILGELDGTISRTSNFIIEGEVEELIEVPLSVLLNKGCQHQETEIIDGEAVTSYFYHCQGRVIWGATARILKQFLDIYTQVTRGR